jgi:hypothetical protein
MPRDRINPALDRIGDERLVRYLMTPVCDPATGYPIVDAAGETVMEPETFGCYVCHREAGNDTLDNDADNWCSEATTATAGPGERPGARSGARRRTRPTTVRTAEHARAGRSSVSPSPAATMPRVSATAATAWSSRGSVITPRRTGK